MMLLRHCVRLDLNTGYRVSASQSLGLFNSDLCTWCLSFSFFLFFFSCETVDISEPVHCFNAAGIWQTYRFQMLPQTAVLYFLGKKTVLLTTSKKNKHYLGNVQPLGWSINLYKSYVRYKVENYCTLYLPWSTQTTENWNLPPSSSHYCFLSR